MELLNKLIKLSLNVSREISGVFLMTLDTLLYGKLYIIMDKLNAK